MDRSQRLFQQAQEFLPGGVDSPVRSFTAVGGTPPFIRRGRFSKVWDEDGNIYTDYVGSWGPLILGHAHPHVVQALMSVLQRGTSFGAPTETETILAQIITEALPSVEMVRFVSSGTEATMSALRLARAFTGREKVIKFEGCYHGHVDALLVKAGSGAATLGVPTSAGVPAALAQATLVAAYNDLEAVQRLFEAQPAEIAAVIVEPVAANMGVVPPEPGFLAGLRQITREFDALLIFDEVVTGFRVAYGGAQTLFHVEPDITCLGKIIGGGLPVGAYGGSREIMGLVAPLGPVYQAGTLSGNPLAMTAGISTLRFLKEPGVYPRLEERAAWLVAGVREAAVEAGVPLTVNRLGSMFTPFFTPGPVFNYATAQAASTHRYAAFLHRLLEAGVYPPPSQFEAWFLSGAHTETDIEATQAAVASALAGLAQTA
ncbi:MAG: glutamate-1-semialdehyde 2,1-aminomutase [Chloroflexi bacterium]|nr:glutamate-1-semialdehyde 2,1-aminomutase [Chloroflexota bacterium]